MKSILDLEESNAAGAIVRRAEQARLFMDQAKGWRLEACENCLPDRAEQFGGDADGIRRRLYSSFPMQAAYDFASTQAHGMLPLSRVFFDLRPPLDMQPGPRLDEIKTQLEPLGRYLWQHVMKAGLDVAASEAFTDLGLGLGCLWVEDGGSEGLVSLHHEGLGQIAYETDHRNRPMNVYRFRTYSREQAAMLFPQLPDWLKTVPSGMARPQEDRGVKITDAVILTDPTSHAYRRFQLASGNVQLPSGKTEMHHAVLADAPLAGRGASPAIFFEWSRGSGQRYGPLFTALADMRYLHRLREVSIAGAELQVLGAWQIDATAHPNTKNIRVRPNTIIPIRDLARNGGLRPLQRDIRADLIRLDEVSIKNDIKAALLLDRLGTVDQPVKSAAEIMQRSNDMARVMQGPFARVAQGLVALVERVLWLHKQRHAATQVGPPVPMLGGMPVEVRMTGPFAVMQDLEQVQSWMQGFQMMGAMIGDRMLQYQDEEALVREIADRSRIPVSLLKSKAEAQMAQAEEATMQGAAAGAAERAAMEQMNG